MAIALRAVGTALTKGTAANMTLTEPAGSAQNDIEVALLYIESDTAVTAPSGWSNVFNGTTMLAECNNASGAFRAYAYWIRRGASAPALTWTFASSFREGVIVGYTGVVTSGEPWSFGAFALRDDTTTNTFPAISGTTLDANEWLIWIGSTFAAATAGTPPTSFNERTDASGNTNAIEWADKLQASAGATGSISGASWTTGNSTATSIMGGLRPDTGGTVFHRLSSLGVGQ